MRTIVLSFVAVAVAVLPAFGMFTLLWLAV